MAYLNLVTYDEGGRIRSLDGLAAVTYDDGAKRNLLGWNLGAVKYDDGGRFRSLFGLGQDESLDIPTDLPLTPPSTFVPITYMPPTPAPEVDTVSAVNNQQLIPPVSGPSIPTFYQPLPTVDTQSAPITGTLTPPPGADTPSSAGTLVAVAAPAAGALTSIFNGIKNIFSVGSTQVKPIVPGTLAPVPGSVGTSWFSQGTMISGLPNWGVIAGVVLFGTVLVVSLRGGSSSGSRRKNPRRRRNGPELLLMGANPIYGYARRRRVA